MKFNFGFICDDCRREDNGKLMFIGAYGSSIIMPELGAVVVTVIISLNVSESTDVATRFQVQLNEKPLISGAGRMKASTPGDHFFPIRNVLLDLKETGDLVFRLSIEDGDWQTICKMPVILRTST